VEQNHPLEFRRGSGRAGVTRLALEAFTNLPAILRGGRVAGALRDLLTLHQEADRLVDSPDLGVNLAQKQRALRIGRLQPVIGFDGQLFICAQCYHEQGRTI